MSDLEDELLGDLENDLENQSSCEEADTVHSTDFLSVTKEEDLGVLHSLDTDDGIIPRDEVSIEAYLKKLLSHYKDPYSFSSIDSIAEVDPNTISVLGNNIEGLNSIIKSTLTDEMFLKILPFLNDIILNSKRDIENLHTFMIMQYRKKFLELDSLLPNPVNYADVVFVLETMQDRNSNELATIFESELLLKKEQTLVLTLSIKTSLRQDVTLEKLIQIRLFRARAMIRQLSDHRERIVKLVESKIHIIAPNLTALVGAETCSYLVGHAGSVVALSLIPSCNLSSIGKKRHLSHELHTNISGVRQEGAIYHCALVREQPVTHRKQMLRMVCAKVSLAARVDAGQQGKSVQNTTLGNRWREELLLKIKKVKEAPGIVNSKVLPIPEDKPKKHRAGRKFRKYKEQFQLSHLRQLQNRMEFGKEENTVLDAYGEEIGMGMSRSLLQEVSGSAVPSKDTRVNNRAKVTKVMKHRLAEANQQSDEFIMTLEESHPGKE
ncbi:U4/U6-U5 snRNP complex subunit PRP31 KNAG_0B01140 [Huiozyma naganishii CBS 8797]|uniref:Nop domain-containing protein n=1 Tax=Huiozyma naganishii (strain ATCC MYA-139 / BCRC 22969 / CBS 8797 / KCTC 17520 / NBRC 10181 / NCYC 3082 / Yp74L-3) TaxID=1071383 RepID=J7S4H0_HUIN7|nr:hypothetical protein KNAG_0B01140 [Kazachstania naganishii CBS 8797]CCK68561.1 hypothetical protein KNAG_0B01140 [Kazachstania naganishii CBS 8797]